MSLIIGSKFNALKVGYPTESDKYDVVSGIYQDGTNVHVAANGAVLAYGSQANSYKVAESSITAATQIAGVLLATNVKVPADYPASDSVGTKPGEAINCLVHGFVAVELDSNAVLANAVEGAKVYITSAGKLTTVSTSNVELPWRFTGISELHGTAKVAEILVK